MDRRTSGQDGCFGGRGRRRPGPRWAGVAAALGLSLAAALSPAASAQDAPAEPAGDGLRSFSGADDLLDALETAGESLDRLMTKVYYERVNDLVGETQIRRGSLAYDRRVRISAPSPAADPQAPVTQDFHKRFAINFDSLEIEGVLDPNYQRTYVFDGEWLTEIEPLEKQFTKRQVVPPGEEFDPLRVGEGPFPVPLGQRKADILERFDAEIVEPAAGLGEAGIDATMGQIARARCGSDVADEFEDVRIWYDRGSPHLLPIMARTVATDGDIATVLLTEFEVNGAELGEGVFDTSIPPRSEGWAVHIQRYRE